MAGPKSELGKYLEGRRKVNEKNMKNRKAKEALKNIQTPGGISRHNEIGYITENGLRSNRKDAQVYRDDRKAFQNMANDMVIKNEFDNYNRGIVWRDYPADRAAERTKNTKRKIKK